MSKRKTGNENKAMNDGTLVPEPKYVSERPSGNDNKTASDTELGNE